MRNATFADHFIQWFKSLSEYPEQATYPDLINYIEHLKKENPAPSTLQKKVIALKHYFDYLISQGRTDQNPAKYLNLRVPQGRKHYPLLTKAQLEQLYHDYDTTPKPGRRQSEALSQRRKKLTVGLMVWQGLEAIALAKLTLNDVNLDKGTIKVTGGRKYKARTLALQSTQIMELYTYLETIHPQLVPTCNPSHPDRLLPHGYTCYADAHRLIIQQLKAKHPFLTVTKGGIPQQIRASVITHWLRQYNLREVQYMAGYRRVCSVEALLRSDIESLQADVDRFFPLS